MGIFSSDRYQVGYNQGYADAMAGKAMSFLKASHTGRECGFDSYVEGYKKGYRDGCYDRTNKN